MIAKKDELVNVIIALLSENYSGIDDMIWIFLPAFNEEKALPRLLAQVDETFRLKGEPYRLVVVNDGSTDSTPQLLESFAGKLPLDVVTHPINRGLGETERDGFEFVAAHCRPEDVIVRLEGDDTHDPKYIFTMIEKLQSGYDVVNTSRFQPGGGQLGVKRYHAVVSWLANQFMRVMFHIPGIRDYSCGFRVYRASVIQDALRIFGNYLIQLRGLGFTSTLEILVKLNMMGCKFAEVPFVLRYDQKKSSSKMVGSITTFGYFAMALLYHWPFGGWKRQYRGLGKLYHQDSERAVKTYQLDGPHRRRTVSRISF